MGLDLRSRAWSGRQISLYGNYVNWINVLAQAAGYPLMEVEGVVKGLEYEIPGINWDGLDHLQQHGWWEDVPEDPLVILLAHCGVAGHIKPQHAHFLARRLEQLLPKLRPGLGGRDFSGITKRFIEGLYVARQAGERIWFSG